MQVFERQLKPGLSTKAGQDMRDLRNKSRDFVRKYVLPSSNKASYQGRLSLPKPTESGWGFRTRVLWGVKEEMTVKLEVRKANGLI